MNNIILIGRLIKDPELRYTQSSNATYARFTIAVDRGMSKDKKQELEAKGQQTADYRLGRKERRSYTTIWTV